MQGPTGGKEKLRKVADKGEGRRGETKKIILHLQRGIMRGARK